ncbi:MAG: haloacid dehalogenase-like hydrolase [Selenomonadaceae bacterium]|nr:haloacid dehalogenase-like hydrolase [Selenomonadaceae bacterium]
MIYRKHQKLGRTLLALALALGLASSAPGAEAATRAELAQISVNQKGTNFKYWNKSAASYQALTSYVKSVTDKKSPDYIPVEERIAVFDVDGTLLCETTPSYFEWMMYLERALNDPTFTPTAEDKALATEIKEAMDSVGIPNAKPGATGKLPTELDRRQAESQERVFAGLTLSEYEAYVKKFMETPAEGMNNLKRGESFYLPMVEVVSYLTANKFKVFIVSGTDRQALRILADGILPIEKDNIIGTDAWFLASHQGETDGLKYTYRRDDEIVRGSFSLKDIKMNKVSNIVREIGRQPVLAFGNSSGDASMFNYTINGNKHKALAFALLCDDTERELGSVAKADSMRASCEKNGWIPVSMKEDFATIYGANVTRADQ